MKEKTKRNKEFLQLIAEHGFNATSFAVKLGVSETAVRHWIKGRNKPGIMQVLKMAKLFNMSAVDVYAMFKNNTWDGE